MMARMMARLRRSGLVLGLAGCVGCGHSETPVAPYDSTAAVPAPRDLRVEADVVGRLVVRWRAPAEDRRVVDGWFVERRVTTTSAFTQLETEATADTVYFDDDIDDDVRYVYRVRSVTGAGVTSLPVEAPPVRGDRTAPSAPVAVTASSVSGGVLLQFEDGGEPDLAFFDVRLRQLGANLPPEFRQGSGSPLRVGGLLGGAAYEFEIAAVDSSGRISSYSAPAVEAVAGP